MEMEGGGWGWVGGFLGGGGGVITTKFLFFNTGKHKMEGEGGS